MAPSIGENFGSSSIQDKKSDNLCKVCEKKVKVGIQCDQCNWWIHNRCVFGDISSVKEDDVWLCLDCITQQREDRFREELSSKDKIIKILTEDKNSLLETNAELLSKISALEEQITDLKSDNITSFSQAVRGKNRVGPIIQPAVTTKNKYSVLSTEETCVPNQENPKPTPVVINKNKRLNKYKWRSEEGNEAKPKKDYLIIGDSMVKNVVINNCDTDVRPGIRTDQLKNLLMNRMSREEEKTNVHNYKGVILHVGTNSLRGDTEDIVISETRNLIRVARQCYKGSKIVISGIIHRCTVSETYINRINKSIRRESDNLGAIFLDPNCFIDNRNCLGRDGLHLNRLGSETLGKTFTKVINIINEKGN